MAIFLRIVGAALIAVALQDAFHTVFHPAARGNVSDWIARHVWQAFRRGIPALLSLAGPLAFGLIVLYWAASVTVGFALIYLPALPHSFTFIAGLHPQRYGSFQGAFVISLASLMTLSSGVYPASLWIQLLMGIESVCGFGLLTASISWMLSIYPVLEHRRSLAQQATLLHFAEEKGIGYLRQMSDAELQQILFGLAAQVATCRNELTQFPITYYFHEEETETALSGMLWYLADIAEENAFRSGAAAMAATSLGGAIEQYLKYVARVFLRRKFTDRREILRAFAEDHLRTVVAEPHPTRKAA